MFSVLDESFYNAKCFLCLLFISFLFFSFFRWFDLNFRGHLFAASRTRPRKARGLGTVSLLTADQRGGLVVDAALNPADASRPPA